MQTSGAKRSDWIEKVGDVRIASSIGCDPWRTSCMRGISALFAPRQRTRWSKSSQAPSSQRGIGRWAESRSIATSNRRCSVMLTENVRAAYPAAEARMT